ncbi:MAG: YraN family protein [Planctomycetota bacterium]|nr:YraN family protein [Planctomycetota bacterium]
MSGLLHRAWSAARAQVRRRFLQGAPRLFLGICRAASSAELGLAGEELVARRLRRRGSAIEARRLRTPWGELDVLARDGLGLVCIEVKTARLVPRPRIRGAAPIPLAERERPGARVDGAGQRRLDRIAAGLAGRRRLPARWEVWEVLVGPGRFRVEIRRSAPGGPELHAIQRDAFMAGRG